MVERYEKLGLHGILKASLVWWFTDAQYETTGEYGDHNVFDDDPLWVKDACKLLGTNEREILDEYYKKCKEEGC